MSVIAEEHAAIFKEYEKAMAGGFRNINKRDYFEDDDINRPKTEQLFETPWEFHKQPVLCYTVHGFMKGDPLEVMAFYVEDSEGNTHNITNQLLSGKDKMQNASGQYINTERACDYMTRLSDAIKQLPHIQTCDEYMSFQSYFRGYMGVEKPTLSDYTDIYLPACRDRLRRGNGIVGNITSEQDLHYAYESAEPYLRYNQQYVQTPQSQQAVKKSRGLRGALSRIFN
ncbi:MAG: hypothetical protein LIO99_14815 [Clostridiales bacterium]|nr:hypothetical protein [Clostridiales bacterium]